MICNRCRIIAWVMYCQRTSVPLATILHVIMLEFNGIAAHDLFSLLTFLGFSMLGHSLHVAMSVPASLEVQFATAVADCLPHEY